MTKLQMMNKTKIALLIIGALVLAACSPAAAATATTAPLPAASDTPAAAMTTDTPAAAMTTDTPAAAMTTDTPAAGVATDTPAAGAATDTPAAAMATDTPSAGTTAMTTTMVNVSTTNATLGKFLVDSKNMTLYTYTKDTPDTSTCMGACLTNWPALVADNGAAPKAGTGVMGTFGVITRSDGVKQVTYNHMPLYYFKSDMKAGDTTGQGVGGVWAVAVP